MSKLTVLALCLGAFALPALGAPDGDIKMQCISEVDGATVPKALCEAISSAFSDSQDTTYVMSNYQSGLLRGYIRFDDGRSGPALEMGVLDRPDGAPLPPQALTSYARDLRRITLNGLTD